MENMIFMGKYPVTPHYELMGALILQAHQKGFPCCGNQWKDLFDLETHKVFDHAKPVPMEVLVRAEKEIKIIGEELEKILLENLFNGGH